MIKAEIVADSVNTIGERITTMLVTFPRIILAEAKTHRVLKGLGEQVEVTQSLGLNDEFTFSRNSASSRAILFKKMLKSVVSTPFIPIAFQKDHSGMQGTEYLDVDKVYEFEEIRSILHEFLSSSFKNEKGEWDEDWLEIDNVLNTHVLPLLADESNRTIKAWWLKARDLVVGASCIFYAMKVSKQICNRLLEPFMWHTVLITATDFSNFFELRCPKYERPYIYGNRGDVKEAVFLVCSQKDWYEIAGADKNGIKLETGKSISKTYLEFQAINKGQSEIHMMALAEAMWDTYNESKPRLLQDGEWHIPFESDLDDTLVDDIMIEKSNGKDRYREFLLTKIKIATARCARTSYTVVGEEGKEYSYEADIKLHDKLLADRHMSPMEHCAQAMPGIISRNFKGFKQYREIVENS